MVFYFRFFQFFFDFSRCWLDFGRPRALQKVKKSEKIDFFSRSVLKGGSGRVLGGFRERFGKVLDGFWEDFVLEARIAFGETCVKHFRLKTLL